MKIPFKKYQATGNDFVLIDNREGRYAFTIAQIQNICHRRLGIGADGLMLIQKDADLDFNLVYYNSDGSQSLCGNGCRAAVRFASTLGMVNGKASFQAFDGAHDADLLPNDVVRLRFNDVNEAQPISEGFFLNTGSPHVINFVHDIEKFPVVEKGEAIRHSKDYAPAGTNVNFVELLSDNTIFVRTFERGVEDETLSCGTGVVAAALAASFKGYNSPVNIKTLGGTLSVEFKSGHSDRSKSQFHEIFLIGPAKMVFEGELEL